MTIAYFQTLTQLPDTNEVSGAEIRQRFCDETIPILLRCAEIDCVSVFSPEQAQDPYTDDGQPPELVCQFNVSDLTALARVFGNKEVFKLLAFSQQGRFSADIFDVIACDIDGVAEPSRRSAGVSYNVRYYAPVEDEKTFIDHYLKSHPQLLAALPGIRNIFCYVPVAAFANSPAPLSNCILGNEVVFDSVEALNASMESDVRHRLREDFEAFPVKAGPNTHFAMQRIDFWDGG